MPSILEIPSQKKFLSRLLTWYRKQGRHNMPWRKTKDPYAIFVSEFMLQQTTVGTVKPYYERFLNRFPTVKSLAQSELNDVLALWSGLGYYARARNLRAAMRAVCDDHNGRIPSNPEVLIQLPGVGYYTAGAITTLAFNRPAAALDGNIIRVMMRLLAFEEDPRLKAVQVILRKAMMDITTLSKESRKPKSGPRDAVLALMDLGATICTPKNPSCSACPLASFCFAKRYGKQDLIPAKKEKPDRPTIRRLYALIPLKNKWLMGQRPKKGLFGGLWEFVGVDGPPGVNPVTYLEQTLKNETGLSIEVKRAIPAFEHQLTHKIMTIRPFITKLKTKGDPLRKLKKTDDYERFKWIGPRQSEKIGLSAITKRIRAELSLDWTS